MNVLSDADLDRFVRDGFVRVDGAFPRDVAAACVDELWAATGADRHRRSTWTAPVVRVASSSAPPLVAAINHPRLVGAVDDVLGPGRWQRRTGYGTFPVRFPSEEDPGDAGWHIDGAYEAGPAPPPWNLWVNFWSKQRALLLLMLFIDVGPDDAPTRVRAGSHLDVAMTLVPFGADGASFADVTAACTAALDRPVELATGRAGDVYLCHPFLVHAASWPHRGRTPRFLGQPAVHHGPECDGFDYGRGLGRSAAEQAVHDALAAAGLPVPGAGDQPAR